MTPTIDLHADRCGTMSGLRLHERRGEPSCPACRRAYREHQAARRGLPVPPDPIAATFTPPTVGENWKASAACKGLPAAMFFGERWDGTTGQALRICDGCPVKRQCLDYAIDAGEIHGVWGGMAPNRRRLVAKYRLINSPYGWPWGRSDDHTPTPTPVGAA